LTINEQGNEVEMGIKANLQNIYAVAFVLSSCMGSLVAHAKVEEVSVPASFFVRVSSDVDFLASIGHVKDSYKTMYSGAYYAKEALNNGRKIESVGVIAFNLESLTQSGWGGEMTAAISKTRDGGYDRSGLEVGLTLHRGITSGFGLFAGLLARPTAFSLDWGNSEVSELTGVIGLNYLVFKGVRIYGQYKTHDVIQSNYEITHISDKFQAGFSWAF
jgi:hypothetical protein